jgi:acyl-CoA synthetase (AMP-forming)/AMP-acid ligase II
VVLVFFPGLLFSISLLACFKAGLIAVPVFPPDPRRLKKDLDHFVNIQSNCGAKIVLTHNSYNYAKKLSGMKSIFSRSSTTWPDMTWISVDDIIAKEKSNVSKSRTSPTAPIRRLGEIAFLQYTSGSTSEPKGVMISHANLAHNLKIITTELKVTTETVNVSWLPQYHDMGLIGNLHTDLSEKRKIYTLHRFLFRLYNTVAVVVFIYLLFLFSRILICGWKRYRNIEVHTRRPPILRMPWPVENSRNRKSRHCQVVSWT